MSDVEALSLSDSSSDDYLDDESYFKVLCVDRFLLRRRMQNSLIFSKT